LRADRYWFLKSYLEALERRRTRRRGRKLKRMKG
jgi:hypothetical protein